MRGAPGRPCGDGVTIRSAPISKRRGSVWFPAAFDSSGEALEPLGNRNRAGKA